MYNATVWLVSLAIGAALLLLLAGYLWLRLRHVRVLLRLESSLKERELSNARALSLSTDEQERRTIVSLRAELAEAMLRLEHLVGVAVTELQSQGAAVSNSLERFVAQGEAAVHQSVALASAIDELRMVARTSADSIDRMTNHVVQLSDAMTATTTSNTTILRDLTARVKELIEGQAAHNERIGTQITSSLTSAPWGATPSLAKPRISWTMRLAGCWRQHWLWTRAKQLKPRLARET